MSYQNFSHENKRLSFKSMSSVSTRLEDPSLEELEKHVQRYRRKLHHESERTKVLAKGLKSLQQEVDELKQFLMADADLSPVSTEKPNSPASARSSTYELPDASLNRVVSPQKNREVEAAAKSYPTSNTSPKKEEPQVQTIKGWLEKKGHKPIGKSWSKKWFELTSDRKLKVWENEKAKSPKTVIPLTNAICYARVEKNGEFKSEMFNIRTENRDILLRAENVETKNRWVAALTTACVRGEMSQEERELMKKVSKSSSLLGSVAETKGEKQEKQDNLLKRITCCH